jgi:hypothetical protein
MYNVLVSLIVVALLAMAALPCVSAQPATAPSILFLSKSEGFEHGPVAQKAGAPSIAEKTLAMLALQAGALLKNTKDASQINAENLKNFDMVIFYTQGDLTKPGKDGAPGMTEKGLADLLEWIKNGGRFMGFHSASDTFHGPKGGEVTPFLKMVGGEFRGHGAQFEGTVKIVDPGHLAVASIPQDWKIKEEWYMFHNFDKDSLHVLALLDPGAERDKQKDYDIPNYPIIWVKAYGKGKVYFSALGHRDELWADPLFQKSITDAGTWLMTEGPAGTEPNFDKVVPKDKPTK